MEAQYNMSSGNENETKTVNLPTDALAHKVNVNDLMSGLEAGAGAPDHDASSDASAAEYSEDEISDIDDDIGGNVAAENPKKRKRPEEFGDSEDGAEPKGKKGGPELFKANKMNPMLYSDKQDK